MGHLTFQQPETALLRLALMGSVTTGQSLLNRSKHCLESASHLVEMDETDSQMPVPPDSLDGPPEWFVVVVVNELRGSPSLQKGS